MVLIMNNNGRAAKPSFVEFNGPTVQQPKGIFGSSKFDITYGTMASAMTEAVFTTFGNALDFLSDYYCPKAGQL